MKTFEYYLDLMPRDKAKEDCRNCRGTGEMYACEGDYVQCWCLNSMTYMGDYELAFYHMYIDKRSGKPKKNAKEKFLKNGFKLNKPMCRWCGLTTLCKSCKIHSNKDEGILEPIDFTQ